MSNNSYIKTTILENYYATGDWECFCFDKCSGPEEHFKNNPAEIDPVCKTPLISDCRIYPNALLPKEVKDLGPGTWKITIEFTPRSKI